jgi:hypothetical protein
MMVLTSLPASITNAGHLGGGGRNNAIGCRRSLAIGIALCRQVTEAANFERDKWTRAFLEPNKLLALSQILFGRS